MKLKSIVITILFVLVSSVVWAAPPFIAFSDITSGPKTGNTDGVGSGAIVTIWGQNLGSSQGNSKVYVGNVEATAIYYWKNADGQLPGGPANLFDYHKMSEIAFAIPATAPDGETTIKVVYNGTVDSNTIPFTVRSGNIYFIKPTGNDSTGTGSWSNPYKTLNYKVQGNANSVVAGDILYSVGVGETVPFDSSIYGMIDIGRTSSLIGTATTPFAMIAYPNTTCSIIGTSGNAAFKNVSHGTTVEPSQHWHFSKWTIDTQYEAFSIFGYGRYIGNYITGVLPAKETYSGIVGGNCAYFPSATTCSGAKLFGNEIHDYGDPTGTNGSHHLTYISNRTSYTAEAYEIGWNYAHQNTVYQGWHVYDTGNSSPWSGVIKIHDNVTIDQSGNAINLNNPSPSVVEVYNNLTILNDTYAPTGGVKAQPYAALRVETGSLPTIKIYNNTFFGYNDTNKVAASNISYFNNIMVDTRNIAYFGSTGTNFSQGNNLFYSRVNPSLAKPSWATGALTVNPLFMDATNYDFTLQATSPALNVGTVSIAPREFLGSLRTSTPDIGAFGVGTGSVPNVDTTKPTITSFVIPSTSTSLTVGVTLVATDNVGVTNYCLTETNSVDSCVWSGTNPTYYNFTTSGTKTLYTFVMDAAGNTSSSSNDSVTINTSIPVAYGILNATYK